MSNLGTKMAHNQHIQHVQELPYLKEIYESENSA